MIAGAASLACIIITCAILVYYKIYLVQVADTAFVQFAPPEEVVEPPKPKPIEDSKLDNFNPPTPSPDLPVITADIPALNFSFTSGQGEGIAGPGGDGTGVGGAGVEGGTGMGTKAASSSAFVGQLWDFKRTLHGEDSAFAGAASSQFDKEVLTLISRFYSGSWNSNLFSAYQKLPTRLFAASFYMPNCYEREATHAYDPEGRYKLQSGRWAAVYKARVQAPVSGRFRFVGIADSVMAVRFDKENVLECGLHIISEAAYYGYRDESRRAREELVTYQSTENWHVNEEGIYKNAFMKGKEFSVKAGEWYEMEVLVSEIGGSQFGFCLLIEEVDNPLENELGEPIYQLFRTAMVSPTAEEAYGAMKYAKNLGEDSRVNPVYDMDSYVWPAKNPLSKSIEEKQEKDEEKSSGFEQVGGFGDISDGF